MATPAAPHLPSKRGLGRGCFCVTYPAPNSSKTSPKSSPKGKSPLPSSPRGGEPLA